MYELLVIACIISISIFLCTVTTCLGEGNYGGGVQFHGFRLHLGAVATYEAVGVYRDGELYILCMHTGRYAYVTYILYIHANNL